MSSLRFAVSQLTTLRWELPEELCHCIEHGFDAISLWRPKLSDLRLTEARSLLKQAGVQVACLQWAGGFTGSDGRTFQESVDDCCEAIDTAEQLEHLSTTPPLPTSPTDPHGKPLPPTN